LNGTLPAVTTSVGSVPEVILDDVTGFVTDLDVQRIADALEKLVKSAEMRRRMGTSKREFTMSNFGVDRLVNDRNLLYKKLLSIRAKS
jgi:glycosyltransferase involved in cell wall biosynthesis